jgi:hypothetical protein
MGDAGGANGPSIGNYKGVMLCNRPFAGVSSAAKSAYNSGKKSASQVPFLLTAKNNDPLGLNPIRHPPTVVVERSKKDTALSRHKKFLSDIRKQKEAVQVELLATLRVKEERAAELREIWRQRREKVVRERRAEDYCAGEPSGAPRAGCGGEGKEAEAEVEAERCCSGEGKEPESRQESAKEAWFRRRLGHAVRDEPEEKSPGCGSSCGSGRGSGCGSDAAEESDKQDTTKRQQQQQRQLASRPKWSLSESAVAELEELEADDLLDFCKGLDIDSFLGQLDESSALQLAQERIERRRAARAERAERDHDARSTSSGATQLTALYELLGVESLENQRSKDAFRAAWAARKARRGASNNEREEAKEGEEEAEERMSIADARSMLSNTSIRSLKQVHSAKSLAKVAERVQQGLAVIEEDEITVEPPRIVHIHEDARARLTNKDETYNLAYLHRNPAV